MAGVLVNLKVGEVVRPNTYVKKRYVPPPTNHQDAWFDKHPVAGYHWSSTELAVEEAGGIAKAWLKHPANKLQLPSLQKEHDTDGDGVTNREEFAHLLKAAGASANADILFTAMDTDGDGVLTAEEIKALGQDRDGRAANRGS